MANDNNIRIDTSLGRTRAVGPGPAELPDVQVERRDPIDVQQAAQQLRGLQQMGGYGGYRGGGYNPTGINQGLRGGHAYVPPPTTYGGGGGFSMPSYSPPPAQGLPGGGGPRPMDVRYGGSTPMQSFIQPIDVEQVVQDAIASAQPKKRAGFYGRDAYYVGGPDGG